ncbi:hypothetical protein L3Y34_014945 [Caenorhabditis briggsae]|uniref:non-specific serine/threonine protein kinase n=1 Tax=Caenorhabditis briggsae TaxID=6238 RepID=A0AAE9DSL3_CAEBR|nr:hypothetical protein L3Y34_014945 [Caenorhabditis briggsae]
MEDLMMPEGEKVSMENFALLRVLGKGAYGKVFLVRKVGGKDHNTIYAMKVLRKTRVMTKPKTLEHTMAERQVLERLRGVPFLNILLDEEGHVKLTDFGLSKLFSPGELDRANSYCGTIEYMSPEVINRPEGGYSDVVDWWSLGVISFELLTGCSPFTVDGGQNSSKDIAKRILTKKVPFPKTMDADARDFIGLLLEKKLEKRLGYGGVDEIKTHKFMANIDWAAAEKRTLKPVIVPRIGHDLDTQFFSAEFTSQPPLYSPAESPLNATTLFRGYSYVSPSVIFANDNVIGEELMAEDVNALLASSSFFAKYKLDKSENGLLGKGAFSVVRRCERVADGAQFAVKIVSQRFASQAQREARILEMVQGHPNIVQLHDVHSDPLHFYLIMELLTGNELLERIRKLERFTECEAADIMRQLVSSVKYLHDKRIVHRDLKPENILFESTDSNARLRLVDFGFARLLPNPMEQQLKTPCFTLQYAAPEVLDVGDSQPEYNEQCDLWSLGVVLFTMLSGQVPFHARSRQESATEIMQRICRAEFSFEGDAWTNVSSDAKNLITGLLTVDPKKRLSMQELTAHMWLKSSAAMDTPLQTPSILPSSADETFNETLRAFLHANRDGFHLLDVAAAPLMKRRGIKRQSGDKDSTGNTKNSRITQFECLPEEQEMEMTSSTSRPSNLGMMNYREPNSGTIRETRGSDSS